MSYFLCSSWQSSSKSRYVVKRGFGTVDGEERATHRVSIRSTVRLTRGWPSSGDFSALLPTRTISVFLGTRSPRREELQGDLGLLLKPSSQRLLSLMQGAWNWHQRSICTFAQILYILKKWAYNLCYKSRHTFACNPESWLSNIPARPCQKFMFVPSLCPHSLKMIHSERQLLFSKFPIILYYSWLVHVFIGAKKGLPQIYTLSLP